MRGESEPITIPLIDLLEESGSEIQTKLILTLVRDANNMGLEGKRLVGVRIRPSFHLRDLTYSLEWEKLGGGE